MIPRDDPHELTLLITEPDPRESKKGTIGALGIPRDSKKGGIVQKAFICFQSQKKAFICFQKEVPRDSKRPSSASKARLTRISSLGRELLDLLLCPHLALKSRHAPQERRGALGIHIRASPQGFLRDS